jgi:hypothetical protein
MKWFSLFLGILFLVNVSAQENPFLDWDIESVFDVPAEDTQESSLDESFSDKPNNDADQITVLQMINRRSLTFDISYGFAAGISPGLVDPPWDSGEEIDFSWNPVAKLSSSFSLDARISSVFRVMSNFNFSVPDDGGFKFILGDFFFDYNLFNVVFFRGGKYNLKWGISPNYGFTNLLARVPDEINFVYDSFILKADIPAGVGGFQFLALTRADLTGSTLLDKEKVGVGGKYNLALRKVDIDMGVYYQHRMPVRGFISLKTTIVNTEVYSEGLAAYDYGGTPNLSGAFNLGFAREFFDKKLAVNGEFFFNNEGNSFIYSSKTDFLDAKTSPFIDGLNVALNLRYSFGGKGNPRFFLQTLYTLSQNSARVVPAFRLSPFSHIELYLAFPMDLGNKDGYYYKNSLIQNRGGNPLRFAAVFLVSLSGNFRFIAYSPD